MQQFNWKRTNGLKQIYIRKIKEGTILLSQQSGNFPRKCSSRLRNVAYIRCSFFSLIQRFVLSRIALKPYNQGIIRLLESYTLMDISGVDKSYLRLAVYIMLSLCNVTQTRNDNSYIEDFDNHDNREYANYIVTM